MNINANVGLRDRSRITLGGFKGLDTLSAAVDVSAIHATEMKNLISRDGVNHKRFGWKTQYRITDVDKDGKSYYPKIQGIFDFNIYGIDFLIVYAGKKFWLVNRTDNSCTDITTIRLNRFGEVDYDENSKTIHTSVSPIVDTEDWEDVECKFFVNNNKVYFTGIGDYLVFSKWENECFELRRVIGNEDIHIPTTTENIGCQEYGAHHTRITAEERNLLTPYFYNTLFGPASLENMAEATYYLDTTNFTDIQISIETKTVDGNEVEVVLEKTNSDVIYGAGDRAYGMSFNLNNIREFVTDKILSGYTFTWEYRWLSYYDFEDARLDRGKDWSIYTREEFDNGYGNTSDTPTYQDYLDVKFEELMGYPPDLFYQLSGYIEEHLIKLDPTKYLMLISMTNNDMLCIKNTASEFKEEIWERTQYKTIKLSKPSKIDSALVYRKHNGEEIFITKISTTYALIGLDFEGENTDNYCVSAEVEYKFGGLELQCNLSNFEVNISTINYNIVFKKLSTEVYSNGDYKAEVSKLDGRVTLIGIENNEEAYAPKVPNKPNIKVKLFKEIDSSLITKSLSSCEFGAQGAADRLFLVDNTGNTVRWSKDEDFTYFGEKSWCVCGTSDKNITGMDRLNDSTLLIVKEYSPREPSIYIITGNIVTGETEAGTVDYTALFTPHGYQVGMGAVGEIVNFNGDCIMVGKDGLYAVSLGENMTVDSRYVLHRSRQISNKLEKFDLANAKCVSFNGKFFVAVGGKEQECYIADNKYTASFKGDIQNVVNYEWWRWTNIPVNVWGFVGNELWFGTNDGQLCCFTENFYDETFLSFPAGSGLLYYNMNEKHNDETCDCNEIIGFGFSSRIQEEQPIAMGDIFTPTCDFYGGITTDKFECDGDETRFYLPLKDFSINEKIYINNTEFQIIKHELYFSINFKTTEKEITFYRNYKNKSLSVYGAMTTDRFICINGETRFYDLVFMDGETIYINNTAYKTTKHDSYVSIPYTTDKSELTIYSSIMGDYVVLKDSAGNFPIWSQAKSNEGLNPCISDFSATLSHKEPVVSKWVSGAMDLGTRAYSKSLTYLVLTGEKDLANHLKYGLKTRFTYRDYELLRANNDLDFNELDLQTVSMDSDFASSYTKKLNIRNINFLMFYFVSDTAEDVALNSIQIEFKLYKRNIGVR